MIHGKRPGGNDNFETPQWLYDALDARFKFNIDAACDQNNCKVFRRDFDNLTRKFILRPQYFGSEFQDGKTVGDSLLEQWRGYRVFCNPPYSRKFDFIEKAIKEIGAGCPLVVMILPFTLEVYRRIKDYHFDVLAKRISFIEPGTGKETKGNTTGTCIVYFWGDIEKPDKRAEKSIKNKA